MNWTGGALPRSRQGNAKAALTNVQKKHFAKARGKVLGAPASSPEFDTAIFKDASKAHKYSRQTKPYQPFHSTDKPQTRLNDSENIAAIVKRLESLKPRRSDDRVSEEPAVNNAPPQAASYSSPVEEFEAKRQELLRRTDWIGLANTKPVNIKFSSAKDRERIGKRRCFDDSEYKPAQKEANKRQKLPYDFFQRTQHHYGQPSSSIGDISIRIGDQGGRDQQYCERSANGGSQGRFNGTPEEMLFDHEFTAQRSTQGKGEELNSKQQRPTNASSLASVRQSNGRATPASYQTSWAGLSPRTGSEVVVTNVKQEVNPGTYKKDFRGAPAAKPISAWAGSEDVSANVKQKQHLGRYEEHVRRTPSVDPSPTQVEQPWAGIPGLPLIFPGSSRTPIDISSSGGSVVETVRTPSAEPEPSNARLNKEPLQTMGPEANSNISVYDDTGNQSPPLYGEDKSFVPKRDRQRSSEPFRSPAKEPSQENNKLIYELVPLVNPSQAFTHHLRTPTGANNNVTASTGDQTDNRAEILEVTATNRDTRESTASPIAPRKIPTPADEELIWRKFVFGSDDMDLEWTLEDENTKLPQSRSESPMISSPTSNIARSDRFSLLAEASTASNRLTSVTDRTSSPDHPSLLAQPSTAQSLHPLSSTPSPRPTYSSLPSNPLLTELHSESPSKVSLEVQASMSASPSRNLSKFHSLSSDELAATPPKPTFVFRKPTRYVNRDPGALERIHLGSAKKKSRNRATRTKEIEIWKDEGDNYRGEDEIEDDST